MAIKEAAIDWWVCDCGNNPGADGFYPCSEKGEMLEPDIGGGWDEELYVCYRCGDIINQNTLAVVGSAWHWGVANGKI